MSLSKLDPTPTSGSSSHVPFDDQDLFSEKQHPLLLPTVLDKIFSYLTFPELKSNRLVCKTWSEVAIPFIGRRKLKPVNFYDLEHEDFLALEQEFQDPSKSHPKLKLFQGFRLIWEDVVTMTYFMPSFKPSQLYISGNVINNPTVSLRTLLQPIVSTLKDLTLKIKCPSLCPHSFLRNLAGLEMTLQRLHLHMDCRLRIPSCGDGSNLPRILSNLLANQAPFLEELSLKFECYVEMNDNRVLMNKVQFPIFPRLQSLALDIGFKTAQGRSLDYFQPFDFCGKFPNLSRLDLLDFVLFELAQGSTLDLTNGHPLKKLNIISSTYKVNDFPIASLNKLGVSFPYLEEFYAQDIMPYGVEIPWVNTMKNLEIFGTSREFNFLRLKKLKYLRYTIYSDVQVNGDVNQLINRLLVHYNQLHHLKKLHLSGLKISRIQMIEIQMALSEEFRAILTINRFN